MKKYILKTVLFLIITGFISQICVASNLSDAEQFLRKAKMAQIEENQYDLLNEARKILEKEYENDPGNTRILLDLSETFQLIGDRAEAKLYVLKAYNMNPSDSKLQKAMGDFFFSFQEYSTAIEYYKAALASGLLKDYKTNIQVAECYEKLGDAENAELYYKISLYVNPDSREAKNKLNEFESARHPDNTEQLEKAKYKYLFKDKPLSEEEQTEKEVAEIIEQINK